MEHLYPCFGLSSLGLCAYNPAQPTPTYFTVGDAIAALGFMLAIQQLFKPIYRFRLRAYSLRILHLAWGVFFGALCSVIALLLPNLPLSHSGFFEYPLTWELIGGISIGSAYAIVAMVSPKPARLHSFNLAPFVRAASSVLSAANDDDRVSLAADIFRGQNLERLMRYASFWGIAEGHASQMEFDRLPAIGAPLSFGGRPPAVQLIDKLRQNMGGWYPSVSRVLLAVIGPYAEHPQITKRTAYVILKDAVYKELQKLPALHAKNPERIPDYFPSSVTYNVSTNTITHTYRGGGTLSTDLTTLVIPEIDLTDQQNWQTHEAVLQTAES